MLQAYLDHLCVAPGGAVRIHANPTRGCRTSVRRLIHSDPGPGGPGLLDEACDWGVLQFSVPHAASCVGSYGVASDVFAAGPGHTISMWLQPTDLGEDSIIASWTSAGRVWTLGIHHAQLTLSCEGMSASLGLRHRERVWHFLGLSMGPAGTTLFSAPWGRTGGPLCADVDLPSPVPDEDSVLVVGASAGGEGHRRGCLDGRIAGLRVHSGQLSVVGLMNEMNGVAGLGGREWDFADTTDPDVAPLAAGGGGPLALTNAPARSGLVPPPVDHSLWRSLTRPGSIHFHRDDTEDCGWPLAAEITVPAAAGSGFYSVALEADGERFELPFIVSGRASVTLLAPTLTWQAYANLGRDPQIWPGRSHYALHTDGSPVFITTSRRPSLTFAPGARLEVEQGDAFLDGPVCTHLLMADLYAQYWLSRFGPHAVMDDRDLHLGGVAALDGVEVLVLSAHPEYWTAPMRDALDAFLARGGSVIYLGGNGLYWVTALHPTKPWLMEVRRFAGSQTVSADAADRMHQFASCQGGTWTDAGRPPNEVLGVGFAGFGGGPPMSYTRTAASYDPLWTWVFDGVEEPVLGGHGLNFGAGNEFDAYDESQDSAGQTVVLATSRPDRPDSFGAFEVDGSPSPDDAVRADMTMTQTPAGGLVFALGSITASGCLPAVADIGIGRVCSNVLSRMLEQARRPPRSVLQPMS